MSTRNTLLFGAALAASTAAIAYDHVTKPLPPRPVITAGNTGGAAPCAAGAVAPCAAGAPVASEAGAKLAAPPPPLKPAEEPALSAPPPPPKPMTSGDEVPDLAVGNSN